VSGPRIYTGAEARALLLGAHHEARAERAEAALNEARSSVHYLARQVEHEGAEQQRTWRALGGEGSAPNAGAVADAAERAQADRDAALAHAAELERALTTLRAAVRRHFDADNGFDAEAATIALHTLVPESPDAR
jgi:cysteinyl-tRNA synthetase